MAVFERDPERLEGTIDRLRSAIKVTHLAIVPICCGICATPLMIFGVGGIVSGCILGISAGHYLSQILGSILEWMMVMLVYLDNLHDDDGK